MSRLFSDDHIYRDLTIALALLLILSPGLDHFFPSSKFDSYLTVAFLVFALFEITRRASDLLIGLGLGIPAVAGSIFNAATPDTPAINLGPTIFAGLFLGFLVYTILKDISAGSRISSEKIFGAVCAYLLIGFLFSSIYVFIALVDPEAFTYSEVLASTLESSPRGQSVFSYFSFVTMSTLGYGDISPVSTAARSCAWIQAVVGQLYLAITIAALVGIHIARGRD
jgi:hypothetical protein